MTVPSLLRDIACKAVDEERDRTTRLDRESDVVKNSDGRMPLELILITPRCSWWRQDGRWKRRALPPSRVVFYYLVQRRNTY